MGRGQGEGAVAHPSAETALLYDGAAQRAFADEPACVLGLDAEQELAAVDFEELGPGDKRLADRRRAPVADADLVANGSVSVGQEALGRILGGPLHLQDYPG